MNVSKRSESSKLNMIEKLENAIETTLASDKKLSISSVARAANVTPALIHNTYPSIADKIRNLMGKSVRAKRHVTAEALAFEKTKNKLLRLENEKLLEEVARLASINQCLIIQIKELKPLLEEKVAILGNPLKK